MWRGGGEEGREYQSAFEKLKQMLSFSLVLLFPKGEEKFVLDMNASNIEIGAVLSQRQEGKKKVIK